MFRIMKSVLATVMIIIAAGILVSCGDNELAGKRYQVEKEFTRARNLVENFSVKPELRGEEDYSQLVTAYLNVWEKFRELFPDISASDSLEQAEIESAFLAGRSVLSAVGLLLQADQLDSASTLLDLVIENGYYPSQQRHDALLTQGRIAADQGRWTDAEAIFETLLKQEYPPLDRAGFPDADILNLPSMIVDHYAEANDRVMAQDKANWAIDYYNGLVEDQEPTPLRVVATRKLAEMYAMTSQYSKAADLLETVVDSTGKIMDPARAMIADLYVTQLNRMDDAVEIYKDIIANGNDSISIATSHIKLATLMINGKQFQEGRNYLDKLRERFPMAGQFQAQAQRLKANSFELEGNYERARQEYVALLNEYPTSPQALETLVYLPEMFDRMGQPAMKQQWTDRAEGKLRDLERDYANRQLGAQASSYLGTFLLRNERYEEAVEQYQRLRAMYPKSSMAADALVRIGFIYQNDLKDKEAALEAFREFLKQYPNSVVRSQVEERIRQLEKS